jgi:hypothetical protein
VKNPPRPNSKGRPKEKVDRLKSIVMQTREKSMKKKGKGKGVGKKAPKNSSMFLLLGRLT